MEKMLGKKLLLIVLVLLLSIIVMAFTYIVTNGDMNLLVRESFGCTFTSAWDNLLKGRFDVDPYCIGFEAFVRDGKTYTNFGIFPALLRGIIELFFKRGDTDWSRISCILAATIIVIFCTLAYLSNALKNSKDSITVYFYTLLFGLTIAFGSPVVILLSSAFIYHEVILWGLAWACVFIWAFIKFINGKIVSPVLLLTMSLSSGLALLSRVTFGLHIIFIFVLLMLVVIFAVVDSILTNKIIKKTLEIIQWSKPKMSLSQATFVLTCGIIPLLLCISFSLKVNFEKWGDPFCFCSYKYYPHFSPTDLQNIERTGVFNLYRIPYSAAFYFIPSKEYFSLDFPFLRIAYCSEIFNALKKSSFKSIREIYFYGPEWGTPLTINSPYLVFISILGLFILARNRDLIKLISFLVFLLHSIFYLGFYGISIRYLGEFIPLLVFCSIHSFQFIAKLKNKKAKLIINLLSFLLTISGIYTACSTTTQIKLAGFLSVPYAANVNYFYEKASNYLASGNFNYLPIHFAIKVRFDNPTVGASEPLLTTGKTGVADFIYVSYLADNMILFGHAQWDKAEITGPPVSFDPEQEYWLEINLGTKNNPSTYVKFDNQVVLSSTYIRYPTTLNNITIGENYIGGTCCSPNFSGSIIKIKSFNMVYYATPNPESY